jgi:hypothetical protein
VCQGNAGRRHTGVRIQASAPFASNPFKEFRNETKALIVGVKRKRTYEKKYLHEAFLHVVAV